MYFNKHIEPSRAFGGGIARRGRGGGGGGGGGSIPPTSLGYATAHMTNLA